MQSRFMIVLFILLTTISSMALSYERGVTGIVFTLDAEGMFWNPTIRSLKVDKVSPKSAAAVAGVLAGDEIIEIAGTSVAGRKSKEIMPLIQKEVGESVPIKVKRLNGEVLIITLVLTAKS